MAVRFSFIIPVLNEGAVIAPLLRQLREGFPNSELIVVDGGSADDTPARATPLCDKLLRSEPGRALQMNLGAAAASGDYLLFLHADSLPGLNEAELRGCLSAQPAWGFCRVRLDGHRPVFRLIEWFINQRSRLTGVATGDQMLFVQRQVFAGSGGFDPIPLMEDVALSKRLRRRWPPGLIRQPVTTSSRRWEQGGVVRTVLRMWWLRLAYFCGASPAYLWRHYYGR